MENCHCTNDAKIINFFFKVSKKATKFKIIISKKKYVTLGQLEDFLNAHPMFSQKKKNILILQVFFKQLWKYVVSS